MRGLTSPPSCFICYSTAGHETSKKGCANGVGVPTSDEVGSLRVAAVGEAKGLPHSCQTNGCLDVGSAGLVVGVANSTGFSLAGSASYEQAGSEKMTQGCLVPSKVPAVAAVKVVVSRS